MYKILFEGELKKLFRKGWKRVASGENLAVYMNGENIAVVERISGTGTPRFTVKSPLYGMSPEGNELIANEEPVEPEELSVDLGEFIEPEGEEE